MSMSTSSKLDAFEKRKKKRSSKENTEFMERFKMRLEKGEEKLKAQLEELSAAA